MRDKQKKISKADVIQKIKKIGDVTNKNITDFVDSSKSYYVDKKKEKIQKQLNKKNMVIESMENSSQFEFVKSLSESVIPLNNKNISKAKKSFPIPVEQEIIWMDAEFDLRPSGVIVTGSGVFIKSNTNVVKVKKTKQNDEGQIEIKPSVLYYFKWDSFDPSFFISEDISENLVLTVDSKCQKSFINACKEFSNSVTKVDGVDSFQYYSDKEIENTIFSSVMMAEAVQSADIAILTEQNSVNNTKSGHGKLAEEANTILDRLKGHSAQVIGGDNAKNGADRLVDGEIFVQTKYCKSGYSSLESSFDSKSGQYRYIKNEKPMQLEVPEDQYVQVLRGFEKKIKEGKVPGVSNTAQAKEFVRKGNLTYQQALNLAKPGTIESIKYDAATGSVTCSFAFGISFLATVFFSYRKSGDMTSAIRNGIAVGITTFGLSFVQHILVSQVGRTKLAAILMNPSQQIVGKLGTKASAGIVNGIRALSGKTPIYGAAASKHLAKIFRSNVFTATISFAVFSIPDSYKMLTNKISGSQYAKNMGVLLSSFVGAAGGSVASGIAAAKVAGIAGTSVAPGVGTVVGLVGGLVSGVVVSGATNWASDVIWESDFVKSQRLFNAIIRCLVSEYTLDESETEILVDELGNCDEKTLRNLFIDLRKNRKQEEYFRSFLKPYFEKIIEKRQQFVLPTVDEFYNAILIDAEPEVT